MKTCPLISVITVVKNDAVGLLASAHSVLSQHYPHIEWIVIDGLSTDLTSLYVKQLSPNLSKYTIERDDGIYSAMNKGIDMATGEWTFFLNADDVFYSSATVGQYVRNIKDGDDFVYSDVIRREDGIVQRYPPPSQWHLGMIFDHQTVCGRTAIYRQLRFDDSYTIVGDFHLYSRARTLNYRFRKLPWLIGCRKSFDSGESSNYFKRQQERIRVIKSLFKDTRHRRALINEYDKRLHYGALSATEYTELVNLL